MTKKIHSIENLKKLLKNIKQIKKIVLCHGVFDLLHIGHIRHFNEAKNLGDILIVTVTPDQYVNKGQIDLYFLWQQEWSLWQR